MNSRVLSPSEIGQFGWYRPPCWLARMVEWPASFVWGSWGRTLSGSANSSFRILSAIRAGTGRRSVSPTAGGVSTNGRLHSPRPPGPLRTQWPRDRHCCHLPPDRPRRPRRRARRGPRVGPRWYASVPILALAGPVVGGVQGLAGVAHDDQVVIAQGADLQEQAERVAGVYGQCKGRTKRGSLGMRRVLFTVYLLSGQVRAHWFRWISRWPWEWARPSPRV